MADAHATDHRPTVFAVDYDRTLTGGDLRPDDGALAAIAMLRAGGIRCFLVTGRPRRDLVAHPALASAFDGYCLEGGAQWGTWDHLVGPSNAAVALAAAARLEAAGILVERRNASFGCARTDLEAVRRLAGECCIQANHDRLDVLPPGIDKGVGLDAVLAHALLRGAHVVALGDGENDVALLARAEVGLATGDARPVLRKAADEVLQGAGPAAVVEAARRLLAGDWRTGKGPPGVPVPP